MGQLRTLLQAYLKISFELYYVGSGVHASVCTQVPPTQSCALGVNQFKQPYCLVNFAVARFEAKQT